MNFAADFSPLVVKGLAKKGIRIIGSRYAPDPITGSFANGYLVYSLDDNGRHCVFTHRAVVEISKGFNQKP